MTKHNIEYEIRSKLGSKCMTLTSLVDLLNEDLPEGKKSSVSSISNKLKRGSIKYRDVIKIAETIGYEIVWKEIEYYE